PVRLAHRAVHELLDRAGLPGQLRARHVRRRLDRRIRHELVGHLRGGRAAGEDPVGQAVRPRRYVVGQPAARRHPVGRAKQGPLRHSGAEPVAAGRLEPVVSPRPGELRRRAGVGQGHHRRRRRGERRPRAADGHEASGRPVGHQRRCHRRRRHRPARRRHRGVVLVPRPTPQGVVKPDVVAPGDHLISLRSPNSQADALYPNFVGSSYRRGSGTSFSAPIVSGAAALYLSANPTATNDRVKYALTATAHPLAGATTADQGAGVIDVAAALLAGPGAANQDLFQPVLFPNGTPSADDLVGVDTSGSNWSGSNWSGSDWSGSNWSEFDWLGSNWSGSNWSGSNWSGSNWSGSNWSGSNWSSQYWS